MAAHSRLWVGARVGIVDAYPEGRGAEVAMDELEAGQAWRESFARFATDWILGSGDPSCRIALMRVQDFLRLTPPISARIASEDRFVDIDACLASGTPFSTPLELILEYDGEGVSVLSHDGRHRAMRLLDLQPFVPVHIVTEGFPPGDDVLESIETIVPEMHDEDEDYPGWEPEDLDARQDEVKARDVFRARMKYEDVAEILGIAAGPSPR